MTRRRPLLTFGMTPVLSAPPTTQATADGVAKIHIEDKILKLIGPYSIIGRSVGIGDKQDDLGKGGHPTSLTTGNVGQVIACGVVGIGAP